MSMEELKEQYYNSKKNDNIIEVRKGCFELQNEELRRNLQKQADLLLTENKQLAIYIYQKLNKDNDSSWYYEIKDLEHNWNANTHKRYLSKATQLLQLVDFESAKKIINVLKGI